MLRRVTVPVFLQHRGNLALCVLFRKQLRVSDIVVVGDTAILVGLVLIAGGQYVHLVSVATIGTEQRGTEVRVALVLVVAAGVVVVQVKAEAQSLVGIHGKFRIDMVFTVLLVTAVVVADVRIGRQRVQEVELVGLLAHVVVTVHKEELALPLAVYEDTAQARRVVTTCGVVLAVDSRIIDAVLVEMGHRVELTRGDVTKQAIHRPRPYASGNFLVAGQRVALVGVEVSVAAVGLIDVAVLVQRLKRLCLHGGHAGNE